MRLLLVSGVGYTSKKILEPVRLVKPDALLLVYGDNPRSELAKTVIRDKLPDVLVRSVAVVDWDLRAMTLGLGPAVDDAVNLLGGSPRCRPIVALSAGHGLLHACLSHLAYERGLEMVYWHEESGRLVRSSHFEMESKPLPERAGQVLECLRNDEDATPAAIATRLGSQSSSVYHALRTLQCAGLAQRTGTRGHFAACRRGAGTPMLGHSREGEA